MDKEDREHLRREKYGNDPYADMRDDSKRLEAGEPLAYVIGNQPFLGLTIGLESHPLIPRPETEWWTEELAAHIAERPLKVLDLCAGSGAIGLALLAHCQNVHVSFGEHDEAHTSQIADNLSRNSLDASRASIHAGDLFAPFAGERFDLIATNPPYIPEPRELDESVTEYEPHDALFAGSDGLDVIQRIAAEASSYITQGGKLWMECDIENIEEAARLLTEGGAKHTQIRIDPYGRPRLLLAYY